MTRSRSAVAAVARNNLGPAVDGCTGKPPSSTALAIDLILSHPLPNRDQPGVAGATTPSVSTLRAQASPARNLSLGKCVSENGRNWGVSIYDTTELSKKLRVVR